MTGGVGRAITAYRVAAVLTAVVVAGGCTSGASPDVSPTPTLPSARASASPTAAAPAPTTPRQEALAAYERYMTTTVAALAEGRGEGGELAAVAGGQALTNARRRLRANRSDDVVVTGTLTPSATVTDVEIGGDGSTATVSDCVLNDLEQVAADDPDRVVTEATGWRQPVNATVENRDGRWIVTKVKVPLRDGSGSVPPPPDDPPYLRGPAQGPAPPSCVPDEIARDAVAAYLAFTSAYDAAIGLGRTGPVDPNSKRLEQISVDPQLSTFRQFAEGLAADGKAYRGTPDTHDAWAISASENDGIVIVYDCLKVGEYGLTDERSTELPPTNPDANTNRLDAAGIVLDGDSWKVEGVSILEEGLDECTSSAQSQ